MDYSQHINQAEDFIEMHLFEKITLDMISHHLGISAFHFHRIFRAYTDETLHQYISRIRIERSAIYLFVSKDVSVTEVAYAYGYSNAANYTRAFKRHFKMTPQTFRKQQDLKIKRLMTHL